MKRHLLIILLYVSFLGGSTAFAQSYDEGNSGGLRGTRGAAPVAKNLQRPSTLVGEVYPNPASDKAEFSINLGQDSRVTVYNLLGSPVLVKNIDREEKTANLEVSTLTEGVYFCTVSVNNKTVATRRLVIKRN